MPRNCSRLRGSGRERLRGRADSRSPIGAVGTLAFGGALPFGSAMADVWRGLADLAERHGDARVRLTPWRTVLIAEASAGLPAALEGLGLIVDPLDARLRVSACTGQPGCASASVVTRALAAQLRPPVGSTVHVSGCEKGCAHPGAASVTLVGREGSFDVVRNGRAGDAPARRGLSPAEALRLMSLDYVRDGAAIYAQSFATIRAEADLSGLTAEEARVAVRVIHACGMVEVARDLAFHPGFTRAARAALVAGKPILCDATMVAQGVTRARLPAGNEVICTLGAPDIAAHALRIGNTRSAAALDLWGDRLEGAVVAIGNAPTALFRLLELMDAGGPRPAAMIGVPVGFVGAAESKEALAASGRVPFLIVRGRKGGSAMAAAAVNALASEAE